MDSSTLSPRPADAGAGRPRSAAGPDERQDATPKRLGGDRVVLGGQRRVGEQVTGAGVVEHPDGAAARLDVADRLLEFLLLAPGVGEGRVRLGRHARRPRTSSTKADTGMAPATMSTPDTVRCVATYTAMTHPSEKPAGTKPSGSSATDSTARCMSTSCPTSSAKVMAGG